MYTYIKPFIHLRSEGSWGICFDERLEYCASMLYKIPLDDFFPLCLFNSRFSNSEIIEIIDRSHYRGRGGLAWFNYLTTRYSDILSSGEERPVERKGIILENNYLKDFPRQELLNKLAFPIMVSIRINNYCDSKCIYCFNQSNLFERRHLPFSVIEGILAQLKNGGAMTLNITGGDPMCHPEIFKILKRVISEGFVFNISTKKILKNGDIESLREIGLKSLQISIDSANDSINKRLIGKNDYYRNQRTSIKELVKAGIEVTINSVVNALNIHGMSDLIEDLNELGVSKITLTPYLSTGHSSDDLLLTTAEQINGLAEKLDSLKNLHIKWEFSIPEQDQGYSFIKGEHLMCSGGRLSLVINCDGNVTICERLVDNKAFVVGNVNTNAIVEIWNGSALSNLTHPSSNFFEGSRCHLCEYYSDCVIKRGACYARIARVSAGCYDCDPFCVQSTKKVRFH